MALMREWEGEGKRKVEFMASGLLSSRPNFG
jgi:hypothetical protein